MIAWDDDVGSASHHVMTSHTIAPTSPARMTLASTTARSTSPFPMVFATAVPNRKTAMKLNAAAQTTAAEGDSTRVEPAHPFAEHRHHPLDHLGELLDALRREAEPEYLRAPRGPVHRVHHVVQIRGELMDVLPVERRDERAVQPVHDLVRDLVGLVLEPLERLDVRRAALRRRREPLAEVVRRFLVAIGDLDEQVEEFLFPRQ